MPTSLPNTVLPDSGRSQQLMKVTALSSSSYDTIAIPEGDALSFTVYVSSMASSALLDVKVEELGASPTNKRLIQAVPQIRKALGEPLTYVVPVGGKALITAHTTGAVSFEIHGKASTAAAATTPIAPASEPSEQEMKFWSRNEQQLDEINENLRIMTNHLRLITGRENEITNEGEF